MKSTNNSTGTVLPAAGQGKEKKSTVRFQVPERGAWYRPESQAEIAARQEANRRINHELAFIREEEA